MSFFYDLGLHYRSRPPRTVSGRGRKYIYSSTMREIRQKDPSFVILSHWDMDHIAGNTAAKKSIFDKDWFAPDCQDACADAQRLAKYLHLKKHLFLASRDAAHTGRMIGRPIQICGDSQPSQVLTDYRLYMGRKANCDTSRPNCEGIVIEYVDLTKGKRVLMMGDVNYASFNLARAAIPPDPLFADMQIDYLIAPHHGSEHTDYEKITEGRAPKRGAMAIICCTNDTSINRPNFDHKQELKKRFDKVYTTEEAHRSPGSSKASITISL